MKKRNNGVNVKILVNSTIYDNFFLENASSHIEEYTGNELESSKQRKTTVNLHLCGVTVHYLVKEIFTCNVCRNIFMNYIQRVLNVKRVVIHILPLSYCPDTIDYNWNERIFLMVRERCELDHSLSWLSTLGGAFSALGDYFSNCAETAAKISMHQFQLALRMGDPDIASRCRLYFALSLIQRGEYRNAYWIITREYDHAKMATIIDVRLLKMCQGIYVKLKYEWEMHRKMKKAKKLISKPLKSGLMMK